MQGIADDRAVARLVFGGVVLAAALGAPLALSLVGSWPLGLALGGALLDALVGALVLSAAFHT